MVRKCKKRCEICGKPCERNRNKFCSVDCRGIAQTKKAKDDFWKKLKKGQTNNECWIWEGAKSATGHGELRFNKKKWKTHRFAWFLTYGFLDDELCILHHCDIPNCCNPSHLYQGTKKDNAEDRENRNRGHNRSGENNPKSKLTKKQVIEIRELYKSGQYSQRKLAEKFEVSQHQIMLIVKRKSWSNI